MSVFIGALAHRHTVVDDAATSFGGASALFVLPFIYELQEGLGDHTLVYVAGAEGVASFILREDGTLKLNSSQAIGPVADIAPVPNATMTRDLVLTGPDGVWRHYEIFWAGGYLEGPSMGAVPTVQDDDVLEIGGAQSAVVVGRYVIVTGQDDDGFSVFDLYGWPVPGAVANVDDASDPAYALGGARGITAALVGGRNLVFIAGGEDDGISVFELGAGGAVAFRDSVFDDAALHLDGVESLTTAVVGGVTYLIASGRSSGGLSVFSVDGAGQLASVSNLSGQGLGGATGLSSFVLEGETFVSACGPDDSSLGVFHLGPAGELTDASLVFAAMGSDSAFFFKGAPYVLTTSAGGNSLSVYELGGGNDTLVGGAADDLLLGLRGDDRLEGGEGADRLLGGEGSDTLIGGGGDDTYIVDSLGDLVVELAGGGTDRIEASVSVALGAGVENLDLKGSWALNGTGNALDNRLTGSAGDNSLFGGGGADVLTGGAGSDWLDGGESHDEALFQGAAANYLVVHHGGGIWDVVDLRSEWHDATDRLVSIEALGFADRSFSAGSAPSPLTRTIAEDSAWSFKLPDGTMALAGEGALSLTARYCPPGCPSTRRPGRSPARRLRTSPGRSAWRSRASSGR